MNSKYASLIQKFIKMWYSECFGTFHNSNKYIHSQNNSLVFHIDFMRLFQCYFQIPVAKNILSLHFEKNIYIAHMPPAHVGFFSCFRANNYVFMEFPNNVFGSIYWFLETS